MKVAHVIGRFQPFHIGHKAMIDQALEVADHVVVVIGDTGCARTYSDPWTFSERVEMITASMRDDVARISFVEVQDAPYDDEVWKRSVKHAARSVIPANDDDCLIIGFQKDATSFYLNRFPEWNFVPVGAVAHPRISNQVVSATDIRAIFFGQRPGLLSLTHVLPNPVESLLTYWKASAETETFGRLKTEAYAVAYHAHEWDCPGTRKYGGPITAAVDALVYTDEDVLLIRRGGKVGFNTLALPGGFIDPSEPMLNAALRELKEETGIAVPRWKFSDNTIGIMTPFDAPRRSMRGRIITNVLPIYVGDSPTFSTTPVASDDALWAGWVPRSELAFLKGDFFSDHWHILNHFLNIE